MGIGVCVLSTALAIFTPIALGEFEQGLLLLSSMSIPMIAIVLTDVFILKVDHSWERACLKNFLIWCVGFGLYHYLLTMPDSPAVGKALPVLLATSALCIAVDWLQRRAAK